MTLLIYYWQWKAQFKWETNSLGNRGFPCHVSGKRHICMDISLNLVKQFTLLHPIYTYAVQCSVLNEYLAIVESHIDKCLLQMNKHTLSSLLFRQHVRNMFGMIWVIEVNWGSYPVTEIIMGHFLSYRSTWGYMLSQMVILYYKGQQWFIILSCSHDFWLKLQNIFRKTKETNKHITQYFQTPCLSAALCYVLPYRFVYGIDMADSARFAIL